MSPQPLALADHFHRPAVDLPLLHLCLHPDDQDQGQDQGGGDDDNDDEQPGLAGRVRGCFDQARFVTSTRYGPCLLAVTNHQVSNFTVSFYLLLGSNENHFVSYQLTMVGTIIPWPRPIFRRNCKRRWLCDQSVKSLRMADSRVWRGFNLRPSLKREPSERLKERGGRWQVVCSSTVGRACVHFAHFAYFAPAVLHTCIYVCACGCITLLPADTKTLLLISTHCPI